MKSFFLDSVLSDEKDFLLHFPSLLLSSLFTAIPRAPSALPSLSSSSTIKAQFVEYDSVGCATNLVNIFIKCHALP